MDLKKILFIFAMVVCTANSAWATSTYYAKLTAQVASDSQGMGKVYVNTSNSYTDDDFEYESSANYSYSTTSVPFFAFAKADTGYEFAGWTAGANLNYAESSTSSYNPWGVKVISDSKTESNPTVGYVYAHFKKLYNVTCKESACGTISADPQSAIEGTEITLSHTANDGYEFLAYTVKGDDGTSISVNNTTGKFTMPAQDVEVSATYKSIQSLTLSGDLGTKTYYDGDVLDPTGLELTANYTDGSTKTITEGITWAFNPATLTTGTTSCVVTATYSGKSAEYTVTGLTVLRTEAITLYNNSATPYYRIPALAVDPSGNLYAYADFRYGNGGDVGYNPVEIKVRKSTDNGESWGDATTAVERENSYSLEGDNFTYAHGDAAVVADREGKGFLMMCASGAIKYTDSSWSQPIRVGRTRSTDGVNWDAPEDVTTEIYKIDASVTKAFFTSGRICQSRFIKVGEYYRIYSAMCTNKGSLVLYSDDFGETWKKLGDSYPAPSGDEAKIEELPNGNVLLSARASSTSTNGRYFNIFTYTSKIDAQGGWLSSPATSNSSSEGTYSQSCSCNGEILIVPAKDASGNNCYVALQSIPKGSGRNNLVVYYKVFADKTDFDMPSDFTTGWSVLKQISTTTSCYSTMVLDRNGDIAFFYEEDYDNTNGYNLKFQTLSLSALTNGAYTYSADLLDEKTNNNDYLGITSHDDLVGNIITLKCVGDANGTEFNEYVYYNVADITKMTTSTAPTSTTERKYQFIVGKGFNGGYTFQSVYNPAYYLGVSTGKMTLESYPAEFIITKKNKSTACAATAVEMDGFALQYYYPSDMEKTATVDGATAYDDATRFVAIKNVDETAPDRLNYTTKSYGSYFSTDFTIGTKYEVTEDNMNVKVYGIMLDEYIASALNYLDVQATKTDNSLVYVEEDPTHSTTTKNVVIKGSDGSYTCQNLVLTDKVDTSIPIAFTAANATYTRAAGNALGTIVLPFTATNDEVRFYELNSTNKQTDGNGKISFVSVENPNTLEANHPYLYQTSNTTSEMVLTNTNVPVSVTPSFTHVNKALGVEMDTAIDGVKFCGVYEWITSFDDETTMESTEPSSKVSSTKVYDPFSYYIKSGKFYSVNNYFNIQAFRAYFSIDEMLAAKLSPEFSILLEEEVDAINAIDDENDEITGVYSVNGMQHDGLQKGLNIIKFKSGKTAKIMVK